MYEYRYWPLLTGAAKENLPSAPVAISPASFEPRGVDQFIESDSRAFNRTAVSVDDFAAEMYLPGLLAGNIPNRRARGAD